MLHNDVTKCYIAFFYVSVFCGLCKVKEGRENVHKEDWTEKFAPVASCCIMIKLKSMSVSVAITFWITQKFEEYTYNIWKPLSNSAEKSLMSLMKEQRLWSLLFHFHLTH